MKSALSSKCIENNLILVDDITLEQYKTKDMVKILSALGVEKKALIVLPEMDNKVIKSASNIQGISTTQVGELNVYDILNYDKLIILTQAAKKIEEVYA